MIKQAKITKNALKKNEKQTTKKAPKKNIIFGHFLPHRPPQKVAPVEARRSVSKNLLKMSVFLEFVFYHFFDQKIEFFKMHLRGARPNKYCILQIKMNIFNKTFRNETQRKHPKMTKKTPKNDP